MILLLGAKDLAVRFARKRGWINGDENKVLQNKMDALASHYNDETTRLLEDIKDELKSQSQDHRQMHDILVEIKLKK